MTVFGEKEATLAESVSLHAQAEAIESVCRIINLSNVG